MQLWLRPGACSHWHVCHCICNFNFSFPQLLPTDAWSLVISGSSAHLQVLRQCVDLHLDRRKFEERGDNRAGGQGEDCGMRFQIARTIDLRTSRMEALGVVWSVWASVVLFRHMPSYCPNWTPLRHFHCLFRTVCIMYTICCCYTGQSMAWYDSKQLQTCFTTW